MARRILLIAAAAAAAGAALAAGYIATHPAKPRTVVAASNVQAIGGPFTAVDQDGRRVSQRDLIGKPTVMFFGFTSCPDVCPTTLAALTSWMQALGPQADKLNVVYVTIDPERDTPEKMKAYLSAFDHRIRGFTGTPQQIAAFAKAWRVYYARVPLDGGGYTMDHSTAIYLMDAKGAFDGVIGYGEAPDNAVAKLRALAAGDAA